MVVVPWGGKIISQKAECGKGVVNGERETLDRIRKNFPL